MKNKLLILLLAGTLSFLGCKEKGLGKSTQIDSIKVRGEAVNYFQYEYDGYIVNAVTGKEERIMALEKNDPLEETRQFLLYVGQEPDGTCVVFEDCVGEDLVFDGFYFTRRDGVTRGYLSPIRSRQNFSDKRIIAENDSIWSLTSLFIQGKGTFHLRSILNQKEMSEKLMLKNYLGRFVKFGIDETKKTLDISDPTYKVLDALD